MIRKKLALILHSRGFEKTEDAGMFLMTIKSYLMAEVETYIKRKGITQDQASKEMGVSRPRISDVMRGKIDKFTIDSLVNMLTKAGLHIAITVEHAA